MLSNFIQLINDMKIRNKLILSFVVVVFVPVAIVGIFLTGELRKFAFDNALEQAYQNVDRVKKRSTEVINVADDLSYRLSYDERLRNLANRQYESVYDVFVAYREYPDLQQAIRMYKEISNIRFYSDNPTMLNNWEFLYPKDEIRSTEWYRRAEDDIGVIYWDYIEDERDQKVYLSLIKGVDLGSKDNRGVLVINVNTGMLNTILSQEAFDTIIVDSSNNIVAANRPELYGKTLAEIEDASGAVYHASGSYESVIHDEASKVLIEPLNTESGVNGLRIISIFSIDSIVADANRISKLAMTVIIISLLLAVLLIYSFSSLISNRLLRLSKHITKVGTGNLGVAMEIDGKDEIGQLSRQFNSMVGNVNDLMNEVQESNEQKRLMEQKQNEIKFKMMASQINPHFLFNALESIRMEAHLKGETEIARIVRLLGKMMRSNLEVGSGKTTIKDEIEMVQCYLDIQKFRYEDRLKYELQVDPEANRVRIPPLIIQPLVENAVIHGMDHKEEGTSIKVRVTASEGKLHVMTEDNGAGISLDKLQMIYGYLNDTDEKDGGRIGLRNVHVRLQLTYGPEAGLIIYSEPGIGTRIEFSIPTGGESDDESVDRG
ncbi:sensor histidine kinase [Paenibacillus sp. FSL H8-0457]|uniref:cache domain-containing sensor histidine kinase n=1 Tax=unclassified Paenibacillus TaxID=185978 RepID=UPI0001788114|nr:MULTISPECIES: sensor histidine kinase [unclassified Paenibacillus]ACX67822.1 integral membrane sensor signal transduction histidine kinase [Paenibacillus sp. Y412MC10]ETT61407.1 integral membrane sensor signal transduction histidine kinase [Paenibacillus sp. FSL H8-457]